MTRSKIKRLLPEWLRERDAAFLSLDVEKFKAFYKKWREKGFYGDEMPMDMDDFVYETMMYQGVLVLIQASYEDRERAREWLRAHNMSENPWGDEKCS